MIKNIKKLTKAEIKTLKKKFQSLVFNNDFNLVYESQIPNTGIVILDGSLALLKKKKLQSTIKPGYMLGIHEILNNIPLDLGCMVLGKSELIMIQKSDILDAMEDKDSELYAILKENIS